MNELLAKISSYNIFNYLLPGVVFAVIADAWMGRSFAQDNLLVAAFVYYFIGLVVSRVGSLIVEPALKAIGFVKFVEYPEFVRASAKDEKLEVLSEANNSYRTLSALFLSLGCMKLYSTFEAFVPILKPYEGYTLGVLLLALFLFSFRKQTAYVASRTRAINALTP
jgi:hypothetical protein